MKTKSESIKVLYIAAAGRSGSTILGNVLGGIDGFFSAGEVRNIWDRSLIDNWFCGCGQRFKDCKVWCAILDEAFGTRREINPYEMVQLRDCCSRTRHIPLFLIPDADSLFNVRLGKYVSNLERLYRSIRDITHSRVIVDSSKYPSYAYVLRRIPGIDLYILHLMRDPRGVAYSERRRKIIPDTGDFMNDKISPINSLWYWSVRNIAIETLIKPSPQKYLILRYEDFIRDPQDSVNQILAMMKAGTSDNPFVANNMVRLSTNHTISGNPDRFRTGVVELSPDMEWKSKMLRKHKLIVTVANLPLLIRYGYPVKARV